MLWAATGGSARHRSPSRTSSPTRVCVFFESLRVSERGRGTLPYRGSHTPRNVVCGRPAEPHRTAEARHGFCCLPCAKQLRQYWQAAFRVFPPNARRVASVPQDNHGASDPTMGSYATAWRLTACVGMSDSIARGRFCLARWSPSDPAASGMVLPWLACVLWQTCCKVYVITWSCNIHTQHGRKPVFRPISS